MTQAWGGLSLTNVQADGSLTQLFPENVGTQTGTGTGALRRGACEGVLRRAEVWPDDQVGGFLELWDISGVTTGASNNVSSGNTLTNAYLLEQKAKGKARLVWRIGFKGDDAYSSKVLNGHVSFLRGLAARFVGTNLVDGQDSIQLNLVVDGGYRVFSVGSGA